MKTFDLAGKVREVVGKKDSKRLRTEGKVPCVLYGIDEPVHFYCESGDLRKLIFTPNVYIVNVNVDGVACQAIMKDVQFHPVSDEVIHIDFLKISDDKPIKINVPVKTTGFAKGIRSGGKLVVEMRRLTVFALAKDIPNDITIDVTDLGLAESYRVSDIENENFKILNPKSVPVVRVIVTRASRAAAASGEATTDAK
jgi:large subunit ribosomal protein L25